MSTIDPFSLAAPVPTGSQWPADDAPALAELDRRVAPRERRGENGLARPWPVPLAAVSLVEDDVLAATAGLVDELDPDAVVLTVKSDLTTVDPASEVSQAGSVPHWAARTWYGMVTSKSLQQP